MNTKTCKKCGWVYPISFTGLKCKICGEPFDAIPCRVCGRQLKLEDRIGGRHICRECYNEESCKHMKTYTKRRDKKFEVLYKLWLELISRVPKNYPTLTEEQWLKACRHFNGCARCGDDNIDSRGFFITFENGGRYCDWNVVPMCHKCASEWRRVDNPFREAWAKDNQARAFNRREGVKRIVDYLGGIIDGAARASQKAEQSQQDS